MKLILFFTLFVLTQCQLFEKSPESTSSSSKSAPKAAKKSSSNLGILESFIDGEFRVIEQLDVEESNSKALQELVKAEALFMLEQYDEACAYYESSFKSENASYTQTMLDICRSMEKAINNQVSFFEILTKNIPSSEFTYPKGYKDFFDRIKSKWSLEEVSLSGDSIASVITKQMLEQKKLPAPNKKIHFIHQWTSFYTLDFVPGSKLDENNRLVEIIKFIGGESTESKIQDAEYFDDFEDEQYTIAMQLLLSEHGPILEGPKPLTVNWQLIESNLGRLDDKVKGRLATDLFMQKYSSQEKDNLIKKLASKGHWFRGEHRRRRQLSSELPSPDDALTTIKNTEELSKYFNQSFNLTVHNAIREERTIAKRRGIYRPSFMNKYFVEL